MNEVSVLVAKKDVCSHACTAVRTNARTSTTFLRSCLLRIAATVPIDAVLPATSAGDRQRRSKYNDISMSSSALWPLQVKGPNERESAQAQTNQAGRIFLLRVPQGRRFPDNRDTTTNAHTNTHGCVNQCVVSVCGENKSRSSALHPSTDEGTSRDDMRENTSISRRSSTR